MHLRAFHGRDRGALGRRAHLRDEIVDRQVGNSSACLPDLADAFFEGRGDVGLGLVEE